MFLSCDTLGYDQSTVHGGACIADYPGFEGCDGLIAIPVKLQGVESGQNKSDY